MAGANTATTSLIQLMLCSRDVSTATLEASGSPSHLQHKHADTKHAGRIAAASQDVQRSQTNTGRRDLSHCPANLPVCEDCSIRQGQGAAHEGVNAGKVAT